MKVSILYRPDSEFARLVEEYARDFKRNKGYDLELVDLNTREGDGMAKLYDIMQYPSILVLRDDGQLVKNWTGEPLPLMSEVVSYLL
jgi:hypothetical protein